MSIFYHSFYSHDRKSVTVIHWNHHCICGESFYISYHNNVDYLTSTVYVKDIETGKCLSKINVANGGELTTITYDESRNEIYAGESTGLVHLLEN
jgi:hypothetical protein